MVSTVTPQIIEVKVAFESLIFSLDFTPRRPQALTATKWRVCRCRQDGGSLLLKVQDYVIPPLYSSLQA